MDRGARLVENLSLFYFFFIYKGRFEMNGSFSFSTTTERFVDEEKRTENAIIYGKMSHKFQSNFPFCQEGEIVLFMKISINRIIMTKNGIVQEILQKPFIPKFTKVYFVARYRSIKDFKPSLIPGEEEAERNQLFFERFQKEFEKEINEVFK
jgi:hypothetical protein